MSVFFSSSNGITPQESRVSSNEEQATILIVEHAKHLVSRFVEQRGHERPPFLPEELAHLQGIKEIMKEDLGDTSAVLLKVQDGYVIKVNQKHYPVRQNFSCAHEIGHTLFNELKLERYIQSIEYRTFNPKRQMMSRVKARERLCDAAAAEILMPEFVFRKYLSGFGVSVHSIERLANIFRVSIPSTAIRIAEVSPNPCLALLWQPWPKSKPKGLRLVWRAGRRTISQSRINYMPVHKLVKPPSTLHEAYETDNSTKSLRKFKIDNTDKLLPMESKGFSHGETRYVMSLAFLNG